MPNYEQAVQGEVNPYSYNKILAVFSRGANDGSVLTRSVKVQISLKDEDNYYQSISEMSDDDYQQAAGADLTNIFMPFQSHPNVSGQMPGFASGVSSLSWNPPSGQLPNFHHLLPFYWEPNTTTSIDDRFMAPSGDSLHDVLSGQQHYGNISQYRDVNDIRTFGLRLPVMGVGWGHTLTERHPWPSGNRPSDAPSGAMYFKGPNGEPTQKGWEVDPSDYIAAPIDFRYDKNRNVWTCGGEGLPGGRGLFKVLMRVDDVADGAVAWDWCRFF